MTKFLLQITLFCSLLVPFASFAGVEPDNQEEAVDNSIIIDRITNGDIDVSMPSMIFKFQDVIVKLKFNNSNHTKLLLNKNKIDFIINGVNTVLTFVDGEASFTHKFDTSNNLTIFTEDFSYNNSVTAYPMWAVLLPGVLIFLWMIMRIVRKKKA